MNLTLGLRRSMELWPQREAVVFGTRRRSFAEFGMRVARLAAGLRALGLTEGWMSTGDAGYFDDDGFLYVVDRLKDMIVTGGENVYSVEVENALASHPAVAMTAVIGVPHEKWGESVHAFVVRKPEQGVSAEELIAHCRACIADYKSPRSVSFMDSLPLSAAGKVLKNKLREPYWAGRERKV